MQPRYHTSSSTTANEALALIYQTYEIVICYKSIFIYKHNTQYNSKSIWMLVDIYIFKIIHKFLILMFTSLAIQLTRFRAYMLTNLLDNDIMFARHPAYSLSRIHAYKNACLIDSVAPPVS